MAHRVHVTMEVELFVDDEEALRQAAFERLRAAWRSEDDFPFDGPGDVTLGQAVQSLLADAVPLDLPGARRSQLVMEVEDVEQDDDESESDGADEDAEQDDDEPESDGADERADESSAGQDADGDTRT